RREGVRLGIDVLPVSVGSFAGLSVLAVFAGGEVDAWNHRSVVEAQRVGPGDIIIRVNDTMGDTCQMMEDRTASRRVTMLRRGPQNGGAAAQPQVTERPVQQPPQLQQPAPGPPPDTGLRLGSRAKGRGAAEAFREAEGCGQPGVEHYMRRRDGMPLGIDVMQPPGGGFGGGG
ncbi:unnamed protein product, partial [Prorocentrum cordatum]